MQFEIENYRQYVSSKIMLPSKESGQVAVFIGANGADREDEPC